MKDLKPNSKVKIKTSRKEYEGTVMPRTELSDEEHIVLKLKSGYNVGILKDEILDVENLGKTEKKEKKKKTKKDFKKSNPNISIVSTGGTITSEVDYETGGVSPFKSPKELLATVPELADFVNIKHIHTPFRLLSEDMTGNEWGKIAKMVYKDLKESGLKGVVVTHGTDTLHFTSAALSFMIQNLNKPVAVVGAQRSIDRGSFDGAMNLICSAQYCLSDIAEVSIVMHGSTDDEYCLVNRGTKVRKMSTSRRDAFRPINDSPLAKVWQDGNIIIENSDHNKRSKSKPKLDTKFEEKVGLLHHYPGSDPKALDFFVDEGYKGVILA
ncbi:MAG: Glu-tRNA(Gln) amidotransferase subunit GatD, partial [Candidatus Undinarchaeales archaeon]